MPNTATNDQGNMLARRDGTGCINHRNNRVAWDNHRIDVGWRRFTGKVILCQPLTQRIRSRKRRFRYAGKKRHGKSPPFLSLNTA